MKIAICDNIYNDRKIILEYLARYDNTHNFEYIPYEYDSAEGLLIGISKEPVNLIILDIYMDGMTGMEAASILKKKGFAGYIIFATTSKDHAVDSYNLDAEGYIVKPFCYDDFSRRLDKVTQKWFDSFKRIEVKSDRIKFQIFLRDIDYIESGDHCSYIHAGGDPVRTLTNISHFESELAGEPCFLRLNRGYIVNLNAIKKTDNDFIYLENGECIALPVRNKVKVKELIANYYWTQTREMRDTFGKSFHFY